MLWLFAQQLNAKKKQKCAENCQVQITQMVNHRSKKFAYCEQPLEHSAHGIQPAAFELQH
jgi:hypothetical protein